MQRRVAAPSRAHILRNCGLLSTKPSPSEFALAVTTQAGLTQKQMVCIRIRMGLADAS